MIYMYALDYVDGVDDLDYLERLGADATQHIIITTITAIDSNKIKQKYICTF